MNLETAYQYCLQIVRNHYENFPVASALLPARQRKHLAAVYAFAREADDFADEYRDRKALLNWKKQLNDCLSKKTNHPIFTALSHTINQFDLPIQWLNDLITAFLMDLEKNRHRNWKELHDYCHYSANPVGRIVLWLFHYRSENLMRYADCITTALQLTNFWQDISIDLTKERIYIPTELLPAYHIKENDILTKNPPPQWEALMTELINHTLSFYHRGLPLLKHLSGRLKWELTFTILGGMTVLQKVDRHKNRILTFRPSLSHGDWVKIALHVISR